MKIPNLSYFKIITESRSNGPGSRTVLFTQGCNLACPGCANFETHEFNDSRIYNSILLAKELAGNTDDGITISGGEPFQQPRALNFFVSAYRLFSYYDKSVIIFTGYTMDELLTLGEDVKEVMNSVDVIKCGRFDKNRLTKDNGFTGSDNQKLYFISSKYSEKDFRPKTDITFDADGMVRVNGTLSFKDILKTAKKVTE